MRYTLFIFVLASILSGCSNDFDVNADWKEQAVVYGLLDLSEETQYIRVNKAFLDVTEPIQNAQDIAAEQADSIYFSDQIIVRLDEFEGNPLSFKRSIPMERVSNIDEGLPAKGEGLFNNDEYFVYKTDEALLENNTYKLYILTDGGNEVHSETVLSKNFSVAQPLVSLENPGVQNKYQLSEFQNVTISWQRSRNSSFYDLVMKITIEEYGQSSLELQGTKTLFYNIVSNRGDTQPDAFNTFNIDFPYENFLFFLRDNLDPDPTVIRRIGELQYIVSAGTEELRNYRDYAVSSSTFLNAGQATRPVDNIEGGIGLFASVNQTTRTIPGDRLSTFTVKDIACNSITSNLGFSPSITNLNDICD